MLYNPNYSLKVALAIEHMELTTMICLSDLQTLSSIPVRNCPMPKPTFTESANYSRFFTV